MNIQSGNEFSAAAPPHPSRLCRHEFPVLEEHLEALYFRSLERTYGGGLKIKKFLAKLLAKSVSPEFTTFVHLYLDSVDRRLDYLRRIFTLTRRPALGTKSKSIKKLLKNLKSKYCAGGLAHTDLVEILRYEEGKFELLRGRAQALGRLSAVGLLDLSIELIREQRDRSQSSSVNTDISNAEINL